MRNLLKVISWMLLAVFVVCCGLIGKNLIETHKANELKAVLIDTKELNDSGKKPDDADYDWSHGMLEINPDYRGWLKIPGTGVDYPVVMGQSNDTYLRHDFYGNWSIGGTLMLDESTVQSEDGNVLILGHRMDDSTYFGDLKHFLKKDFFQENKTIIYEDRYGKHYYYIFAALVMSGTGTSEDHIDLPAWNNELNSVETKEMLETLRDRANVYQESWFTSPSNPSAQKDKYIILMTCNYSKANGRLVIVGRYVCDEISETDLDVSDAYKSEIAPTDTISN